MAFSIVQVQGGVALADENGNVLGVFDDGGVLRLQVEAKISALRTDSRGKLEVTATDPLQRIRYDLSNETVYIGYAPNGTADGTAGWTIKRVLFDVDGDPTTTEWTEQSVATWNNRVNEVYS